VSETFWSAVIDHRFGERPQEVVRRLLRENGCADGCETTPKAAMNRRTPKEEQPGPLSL
jgi:hypothetical protein